MSHDHAAYGHGGAHGAGQGGYTHAGHGYGGAPKGYAVQHSAACLLYTSPSPRDLSTSRMPSSA